MEIAKPSDFEQFATEIEEEYRRRSDDYSTLENHIKLSLITANDDLVRMLMNALIVMCYSYYEGFCKRLFEIYINYVNRTAIKVKNLETVLAASTLSNDFKLLEDPHHVPRFDDVDFKQNGKLMRHARRIEFTKCFSEMMDRNVDLPDSLTNTESNLSIEVLERIMFTLGLDYSCLAPYRGLINMIVNRRNDAAHGTFDRALPSSDYEMYKRAVFSTVEAVKNVVIDSYKNTRFIRTA